MAEVMQAGMLQQAALSAWGEEVRREQAMGRREEVNSQTFWRGRSEVGEDLSYLLNSSLGRFEGNS